MSSSTPVASRNYLLEALRGLVLSERERVEVFRRKAFAVQRQHAALNAIHDLYAGALASKDAQQRSFESERRELLAKVKAEQEARKNDKAARQTELNEVRASCRVELESEKRAWEAKVLEAQTSFQARLEEARTKQEELSRTRASLSADLSKEKRSKEESIAELARVTADLETGLARAKQEFDSELARAKRCYEIELERARSRF